MEIAKYNDMMAYLTRKDPGPRAKPQELLDLQEKNRQQRIKESLDTIGPSMEPESKEFIERENFAEAGKVDKRTLRPVNLERREQVKQFILDDIEDFEKNRKRFPDEKYQINQDELIAKLKQTTGTGTDTKTLKKVVESFSPKDKKRISTVQRGQAVKSSLPEVEQDFFAKNYKAKTISQMAAEITGKPYDNKITKAKSAQLYRHFLSQAKLGNIAREDVPRGTRPKGTVPKEELKTFENYRKAQKQLMDLDPKTYKDLTPSMLDNRIKKALQFSTVRGAFNVPPSLAPSFEHFQGLVPSTIIQDPEGLRKAGITTKDYNFNVMGAKAKQGMYKTVKDNIRTAKEFLDKGNTVEAKKSLGVVNEIYDDVAKKLKYVDRKKLPKYSLGKEGIRETNLKTVDIGTEKRLGNTIEDYIKFVAAGPKKDIAKIKQPNLAKAVEMIQKGEDKAVKELVKSRLPDVRAGQLFANPMADPALLKQGLKDMLTFGKYAAQIAGTPLGATGIVAGTGVDPRSTIDRLGVEAEAALAPALVRGTQEFTKNQLAQRILNLGLSPRIAMRAARIASPIGIASLLGEAGYGLYKAGQEQKERIARMSPEEREQFFAEEEGRGLMGEVDIEETN